MSETRTNKWLEGEMALVKDFTFNDFSSALAFVNQVGTLAESANHHPDISIHGYNKVRITLTTHEEGRIVTDKDRELAGQIDTILVE